MSVILTEILANVDDFFGSLSSIDGVDDLYASTESLLSDDIWKKFQLDFPDLNGLDDIFSDLEEHKDCCSPQQHLLELESEIRNHDCMWSGQCVSKEHPADDNKGPLPGLIPAFQLPTKVPPKPAPSTAGRSLLLKPAARAPTTTTTTTTTTATVATVSPDSPPMSDDEENKGRLAAMAPTRLFLSDTVSECDVDEDSDLCEYFEEEEEEEEDEEEDDEEIEVTTKMEVVEEPRPRYAGENDHCYFMDKSAFTRVANLGIDTPSDSEEEIDVVSVGEKLTNRMAYTLPTNPSTRDRRHLQRRMATAITNKNMKTAQPTACKPEPPPARRRTQETRGVKRNRQTKTPFSPYKRRALSNHNSDSEHEPSEKRSLHNNMERQRRIDLRNAFEDLRVLVPEVSAKEKAAKVVILREAAQFCYHLGAKSADMLRQKMELKRTQEQLRGKVSYLRRTLAAKR